MVEEMYKEEFGESEAISISSPKTNNTWNSIEHAVMSSTGHLSDFYQNRSNGDDDDDDDLGGFGLMKFEGDTRLENTIGHGFYHSELMSLNQEGDGSSLAQDSQVSLGLGVTRPVDSGN